MEVLKSKIIIANKNHKCYFCNKIIKKGDKYKYQFNVDNGDFWEFKAHYSCDRLADRLNLYKDCADEGVSDDLFQEAVIDLYRDIIKPLENHDLPDFNEILTIVKEKYL